jgi:hypothetical protein
VKRNQASSRVAEAAAAGWSCGGGIWSRATDFGVKAECEKTTTPPLQEQETIMHHLSSNSLYDSTRLLALRTLKPKNKFLSLRNGRCWQRFFVSALSIIFSLNAWSTAVKVSDTVPSGLTITFNFTDAQHNPIQGGQVNIGGTGFNDFHGIYSKTNISPYPTVYSFIPLEGVKPDDWTQSIGIPGSSLSVVTVGNIKHGSPWQFYPLEDLPDVNWQIPDIAPINGDATIYTAVNMDLYLSANPLGFLGGAWQAGDTLSSLGIDIVNGTVAGVQGIQWSVSPFVFDPNESGPGWVPSGGTADYLNSATFGYELGIIAEHSVPEPASVSLLSLGLIALLITRRKQRQHGQSE